VTRLDAERVRALRDGATPGPWWANVDEVRAGSDPDGDVDNCPRVADCRIRDAALIAAAPDLADALLDAWRRLAEVEAEQDEARDEAARLHERRDVLFPTYDAEEAP
jgi:hypothetical protein